MQVNFNSSKKFENNIGVQPSPHHTESESLGLRPSIGLI